MEDILSIFTDKTTIPTNKDVEEALSSTFPLWLSIREYVYQQYPNGKDDWNYPGKNYGWSFRIKDKKRAIIYFLPRDNYFKVAFVFGQKALDQILESTIADFIKNDLLAAKKYAEGRGVSIDVKDESAIPDIQKLVQIKLVN